MPVLWRVRRWVSSLISLLLRSSVVVSRLNAECTSKGDAACLCSMPGLPPPCTNQHGQGQSTAGCKICSDAACSCHLPAV